MSLADATDRLNDLQGARPDVVRLARVASLAVRVESHLLRRLRLDLVPTADVGTEADLWFSRLVESRGPSAIVLHRDVVSLLRDSLAAEPALLGHAIALTAAAHRTSPPVLQLEERLNGLALREGPAAAASIDEQLQPAVRAMRESEARGREIARWWLRAAPRLHPTVWNSSNALALLLGSSTLLQRHGLPFAPSEQDTALQSVAWAMPVTRSLGHVEVDLHLEPGALRLRPPADPDARIRVPATTPPVIEVRWTAGDQPRRKLAEAVADTTIVLGADAENVSVHTIAGAEYRVDPEAEADVMQQQPLCFVVMAFGKKTDFETGRVLDLDATYHAIIKPAAEAAGLQCMRADEIIHSGVIDQPMFDRLLSADIVVADLSTRSLNAVYELGVRHALRPRGTIVIAEQQLKVPFDVNTMAVHRYQHLGEDIGVSEAKRMQRALSDAMKAVLASDVPDSPIYSLLRDLQPPMLAGRADVRQGVPAAQQASASREPAVAELVQQADQAMKSSAFPAARQLLQALRSMRPDDPHIIRQLALATYKSKQPTDLEALHEARHLLEPLQPETSNDPETLGLLGAIHKRLWDREQTRPDLEVAIHAYERAFFIKSDHYNGINLAFLLNVRASISPPAEAVADFVQAQRVRRQVIVICETLLSQRELAADERFWIVATCAEASLGIGDREGASRWQIRAQQESTAQWMLDTMNAQLRLVEAMVTQSPLQYLKSA